MIKKPFRRIQILFYIVLFFSTFTNLAASAENRGDDILAAVATNFYNPFREIAEQFEQQTGHKVQIISGSTGKLYAQIVNGAPFDLFLSADSWRPKLLEQEGKAILETRFTFALGKITLWSHNPNVVSQNGKLTLQKNNFTHIALANPATAPYGRAARQTLKRIGLWKKIQPMVVQGENIGQVFQFVSSQNAELGFVALSQVLDPKNNIIGSRWDVPQNLYDLLEQDVIVLKNAENNFKAMALWKFLGDKLAKQIIKKYGYGLP